MATNNRQSRDNLVFICKKLKENKSTCIRNNKIVLKINYYKTH